MLKAAIALMMIATVVSLFSGLFFLVKDEGNSNRLVTALTVRVVLAVITVALIALYLPKDEVAEGASIRRELSAFGRLQVWLSFGVAAVGFGGMFAIFSYIAKTVTDTAGLPASMIAVVLALFGIGMNVGNIVGSRMADYSLKGTIGGMLAFNIALMAVFSLTAHNPIMLCICVFLTGCGFAACPAVQTRLMDVAADAQLRPAFIGAVNALADGQLVPAPGGVLIRDERGEVLGAIGITGDTSDIDEQCAVSAVESVGLKADAGIVA